MSQYGGRIEAPELLRQVHSSLEGYTVNIEESGEINAHGMAKQTPRDIAATERSGRPVDWLHWATVIVAFGITGMLSLLFSRFLLTGVLHLEGGLWPGPWSYRIAYLLLIPPSYSVTLVLVGTLMGKHAYFKERVLRVWGQLLPRRGFRA